MDAATYVGTEHPELSGKTALVRPHPEKEDIVLAQFDDTSLVSTSIPSDEHAEFLASCRDEIRSRGTVPFEGRRWGFGWHEFPSKDFAIMVRIPISW